MKAFNKGKAALKVRAFSLIMRIFPGPSFPALEAKQSALRYLCRNVEDVFLLFLLKGDDCSCSKEPRRVGLLCWKFLAVCCAVKMLSKTIKLMVGHTAATALLGSVYMSLYILDMIHNSLAQKD